MKTHEYFLLPGPTNVPPEVLSAMTKQMINHRGPEFQEIHNQVVTKVKQVFKTENQVYILTCSGTGGLEASVCNFINPGEKVIVASIGNFGERYRDIATAFGAQVDFIDFGWGNAIDPQVIADRLAADKNREIKAVFMQHNETSTGIVNPIGQVAAVRGDHPALLVVDSVSGLGAADLRTDEWGLDVVVAGSQKAFMSPPGLAFLAVSERAKAAAAACTNSRYYFSLKEADKWLVKGQTPWTPVLPVIFAVNAALDIILAQGVDAIIKEHYFHRDLVRTGLESLGLKLLAPPEIASPAVTTVFSPEGIAPQELRQLVLNKYQLVIAPGQGKFQNSTFRVGHLGAVQTMDLLTAMAGLEMGLLELGYKVELGTGVRAMEKVLLAGK